MEGRAELVPLVRAARDYAEKQGQPASRLVVCSNVEIVKYSHRHPIETSDPELDPAS